MALAIWKFSWGPLVAESGLSWGAWAFISGPRKPVPGKARKPSGAHESRKKRHQKLTICAHCATSMRPALQSWGRHGRQRLPLLESPFGFRGLETNFRWLPPATSPLIYLRQLPRAFGRPPPRARRRLLNSSKTKPSSKHSTWAHARRKGLWASRQRNAWHQT